MSSYIVDINSIISSIINPTFDKAQTKSFNLRINNNGYLEYKDIFSDEDAPFKIHEKLKGTKIKSFIEMGDERGPLGNIVLAMDGTLYFQEDEKSEVIETPGKVQDLTYIDLHLWENVPMIIIVKIDNKLYMLSEEDFNYKLNSKELKEAIKNLEIFYYNFIIMGDKRVAIYEPNYFKGQDSEYIKADYFIITKEDKSGYFVTNDYLYKISLYADDVSELTLVGKIDSINNNSKSIIIKYLINNESKTITFNNTLTNDDLNELNYSE